MNVSCACKINRRVTHLCSQRSLSPKFGLSETLSKSPEQLQLFADLWSHSKLNTQPETNAKRDIRQYVASTFQADMCQLHNVQLRYVIYTATATQISCVNGDQTAIDRINDKLGKLVERVGGSRTMPLAATPPNLSTASRDLVVRDTEATFG